MDSSSQLPGDTIIAAHGRGTGLLSSRYCACSTGTASQPSSGCKFCRIAKAELTKLGIPFQSFDIFTTSTSDPVVERRIQVSRSTTVPQIYIGEDHIGGCDDLLQLISSGRLEELLASHGIQRQVQSSQTQRSVETPEIMQSSREGALNESPALSISVALQGKLLQLEDKFVSEVCLVAM